MTCPRCGEPLTVVATANGEYVCRPCRDARLRAIIHDRTRDAALAAAAGRGRADGEKGGK